MKTKFRNSRGLVAESDTWTKKQAEAFAKQPTRPPAVYRMVDGANSEGSNRAADNNLDILQKIHRASDYNDRYQSKLDSIISNLLDERNISRNVGSGFTPSERAIRIGSRRIQNQRLVAQLLSGMAGKEVDQNAANERANLSADASLDNTDLQNKGRINLAGVQGENTLANTAAVGKNQQANILLQGKNTLANTNLQATNTLTRDTKLNEYQKGRDYRTMALDLLKKGVPAGPEVSNIANTPGWADVNLDSSALTVPGKPQKIEPLKVLAASPTSKVDRVFDPNTGTIQQVAPTPPAFTREEYAAAMTNLNQAQDDASAEKYLLDLMQTNPALAQRIMSDHKALLSTPVQ